MQMFDSSALAMCGTTVTRTAEWSKVLDDQFKTNMANDPSLKWQYFASPTGILRIYPGLQWDMLHCNNRPNMYDCRKKQWYIQAATYPKNVLILLDTSGSMIGTNLFVAEYAVPEIFKFLGDNDFFNVLTFGKDAKPINKCYGFELMPANWKNKRTVLEDISKIKPYGYADYNVTLHTVLDLLKKFRSQQGGSYCDFMLLIITDGAPENFDQIFEKYYKDNDFQIRIFPYLVGYDKSSLSSLRQMACHNNGYFTHLMNRASVRYRVLEQVHILNRPLAFHQDHHVAWTKAYYTGKLEKESSHLVCTISMAAHRKLNGTATLLGVLATDIPLDDILDSIPINNIGVNGYIYMITNNGHTLIHPRFNPRYNEFGLEGLRPNYESIDIDDLENSLAGRQVRAEMINKTGSLAADRIVTPLFGMNRVLILSGTYYYAPIRETPYYLAAVLPSGYGHTSLKYPDVLQRRSHDAKYDAKSCGKALKRWMISATSISRTAAICSLLYSGIGVAESWRYCQHIQDNVGPHEMSQLDMLKAFVTDKHDDTISCDEELVTGVLYDAYHMAVIQPFWSEFRQFRKTTREGVIMTFVISKNGVLMEYWHEEAQGFHSKARNTIFKFSRAEFPDVYRRTVEQPPDDWLYSLPNNKSSMERDSIVIAATKAFRLNNAVLGVAGLLFKHSRFSENFNNFEDMSENCGKRYKRFFDCYLIDENAITLYADDESQVGQYLGLINGPVMSSLLKEKIFNVVELMDYNAVCKTHPPQTNSPASYRQSPIYVIWKYVTGVIMHILHSQVNLAAGSWLSRFFPSPPPPTRIPTTIKWKTRSCQRKFEVALVNRSKVPYVGVEFCDDHCRPTPGEFGIYSVKKTNMFLLALLKQPYPLISLETTNLAAGEEVTHSEKESCEKLRTPKPRKSPTGCRIGNIQETEKGFPCSSASRISLTFRKMRNFQDTGLYCCAWILCLTFLMLMV